jgi:hypothetical protein
MKVAMILIVYRGTVRVSIDPSFTTEAILESMHITSLMDALTQAVKQARGDKRDWHRLPSPSRAEPWPG